MIRTLVIIEDERPNADRLKRLLTTIRPDTEIIAVLEDIAESVRWFSANPHPDVVLMDIRLSDGLSFEIFEEIKLSSSVVFTTAYDEYALRAFKHNGIDYLLKPIEANELREALNKVDAALVPRVQTLSLEHMLNFFKPKEFRNRFLLPFRDGYKTILVQDISFFYSELKITHAKLGNGLDEIIPLTMEELDQQLDPKIFFRANRQFIVHIDAIAGVHNYFNGKLKLAINKYPDIDVVVSREKASSLKNWLDF
ncbi:LytR/AlgR family response regulator transcription factor [Sphingobacterium suaedae]|uniref:LytR/AlgR family response regulator transcription factor n=1 Tax=Sphingobacterium suaedae TaxID=1686402 RepID=A0ABW5KG86_9SPHI